jgi:hypothetical protein
MTRMTSAEPSRASFLYSELKFSTGRVKSGDPLMKLLYAPGLWTMIVHKINYGHTGVNHNKNFYSSSCKKGPQLMVRLLMNVSEQGNEIKIASNMFQNLFSTVWRILEEKHYVMGKVLGLKVTRVLD